MEEDTIWKVWAKAIIISVYDAPFWRKDEYGAWIRRADFDNPKSQYGWVIDYIVPKSQGGTDDISNLRPLQWENACMIQCSNQESWVTAAGLENAKRKLPTEGL